MAEPEKGRYDTVVRATASVFAAVLLALGALAAGEEPVAFVACAPGYPGSTADAQPVMDGFAGALADVTGWGQGSVRAEYHEDEARGLERLARADAGFALTPLPFFLKHEVRLNLVALAEAVAEGGRSEEIWALVAAKGRVAGPAGLDGWEILSSAAYAPRFVRGTALGTWGVVPASTRLVPSLAVLSGLRRASAGEKIALVLDSAETAALPSLPFAKELEVVTRSAAVPAIVVCSLAGRIGPARVEEARKALLDLAHRPAGAAALAAMRTESFVPLDAESLRRARAAYLAVKDSP
jgi:hypothetical protein